VLSGAQSSCDDQIWLSKTRRPTPSGFSRAALVLYCFQFAIYPSCIRLPADAANDTFSLRTHGRYQHAGSYLRAMLAEAGFTRVQLLQADLRYERQEPVAGHLIIAAWDPSSAVA
jgi:hypothetical protein